jgi:hypothetical protein
MPCPPEPSAVASAAAEAELDDKGSAMAENRELELEDGVAASAAMRESAADDEAAEESGADDEVAVESESDVAFMEAEVFKPSVLEAALRTFCQLFWTEEDGCEGQLLALPMEPMDMGISRGLGCRSRQVHRPGPMCD